ncbi:MAG TPA: RdgB/HAM1 family non-canonical purine NTP pyrophosphatase [Candidatus Aveggerthella stercoripullorum]|jgi:XTP/dITP diphosphohydrolase|uniref:dITP/XTP pyrophosphatase n=1 Tax=Candidatus Aveggerthella stercoripullorum TaxID=2840688 RepID=A0A9D1A1L4_9ACTN|nr:RdgB/HAM1 family non-canonical purine NTP pyrophosphatase [Slackia piriformis]HIR01226.1 RdgB/HAM1 family non-canonical purine NTP pyrophosphatase [Candidatus Aveggerthella stercoripullorum]
MKTVVIASNNAHKIDEIRAALDFEGWEFASLKEAGVASDPEENAETFEGNARIKARAAHEVSGRAVLADDSGLEVDALQGEPGVRSARYAGVHGDDAANNRKLLEKLAGIPDAERTARFVCALVFVDEDGTELTARGTVEGRIGYEEKGTEGFGYDPLFLPDDFGGSRTFAEVSQSEKTAISHRGRALNDLKAQIEAQMRR